MNKIVSVIICALVLPLFAVAQVKLYDEMCDPLQAVFCDYVRNEASQNFLSASDGQYTGTLIDGKIYGWGYILAADGTRSFGQFRNGKNIFGLSITDKVAKVGSDKHYVLYDLTTGEIARLYTKEGDINLEYPLPNGKTIKFLDDGATYLGTQLVNEQDGSRCFGIAANVDFILICTYEENGENPELIVYKKR